MPVPRDLHEAATLLGVPPDASQDLIAERYRTLAHLFHPDRNPDAPSADARMQELDVARAHLSVFAEAGAAFRWVTAIAYGPAPTPRHAAVALDPDDCLNLRLLPRVDDFNAPITCLPGATPLTLPGESATDAAGND